MALYIIKAVTKLALATVLLLIMMVACNPGSTQPPTYGVKIQYAEGQPLNFPDVTLEFVGKRESPGSSDYPRGMIFYDFKVHQGSRAQLVSWTAGTGDIGPTLFDLAGHRYALELAISDKLGSLEEDELVLWREVIPPTEAPIATPMPTPGPPREAQDYYDKGLAQFAAGLNEEAIASFTRDITLDPTYIFPLPHNSP